MQELIHADIFFFITSIAVGVIGIIIAVALMYIVFILHDVRVISSRMRKASESLEHDFNAFRLSLLQEGTKVRTLVGLVLGFMGRKFTVSSRPKKSTKKAGQDEDDAA